MRTDTRIFGGILAVLVIGVFAFGSTQYFNNKQTASVITSQQQSQEAISSLTEQILTLQREINVLAQNETLGNMDIVIPHLVNFFYSMMASEPFFAELPSLSHIVPSGNSMLPPEVTVEHQSDGSTLYTLCNGASQECLGIDIATNGALDITFPPIPGISDSPITIKIVCDVETGECIIYYVGPLGSVQICKVYKLPNGLWKMTCRFNPPGPDNSVNFVIDMYIDEQGQICFKFKDNTTGEVQTQCFSPEQVPPELQPFLPLIFPDIVEPFEMTPPLPPPSIVPPAAPKR